MIEAYVGTFRLPTNASSQCMKLICTVPGPGGLINEIAFILCYNITKQEEGRKKTAKARKNSKSLLFVLSNTKVDS